MRIAWALLLVTTVMGCEACGGDAGDELTNLKPGHLRLAETALVFGPTPLQMSQKREIQLYNSGQIPLEFESIDFEPQGSVFIIANQPSRLDVKESLLMEVVFTPTEAIEHTAQLIFTFDGDNSPFQLSVSGQGMANPLCASCDATPASFCMNDEVMAFYEKTNETCDTDLCLYALQDVSCNWGCDEATGGCVVMDAGPTSNGNNNNNGSNNNEPENTDGGVTDGGFTDGGIHHGNNNPPSSSQTDGGTSSLFFDAGTSPAYVVAHSNPSQCYTCADWDNPTTCGTPTSNCPAESGTGGGQEYHYGNNAPLQFAAEDANVLQDELTGLFWRRCLNGGSSTPCNADTQLQNFSQAQTTCNDLHMSNGEVMRIPTLGELLSIVDYESPAGVFQNDFFDLPNASYWTQNPTSPGNPLTDYWALNGITQTLLPLNVQSQAHVLCVAGQPWGQTGPNSNAESLVDTRTGLEWQICVHGQNPNGNATCTGTVTLLPFQDALAYCENLSLNQHNDWRLPTIRELTTLSLWPTESYLDAFGQSSEGLLGRLFSNSVTTDQSGIWVFSPTEPHWQKGGQTHTFRCVRAP